MTRTDTDKMRRCVEDLSIPWFGIDEIRAANEIDRLRLTLRELSTAVLASLPTDDPRKTLKTMARRALQILP